MIARGLGGRMGEGIVRELGMDMYILPFKMENQQGPTVEYRNLLKTL